MKNENNRTAKHEKKSAAAIFASNLKYIVLALAIIVSIIALVFGESKMIVNDDQTMTVTFGKLNYQNVGTGEYFYTLQNAVTNALSQTTQGEGNENNKTIRVLNDVEETTPITIPVSNEITLDLNGKELEFNITSLEQGAGTITNNGAFTLIDSSCTEQNPEGDGIISSNEMLFLNNVSGDLNITSGTAQSDGTVITSLGNLVIGSDEGDSKNVASGATPVIIGTDGIVIEAAQGAGNEEKEFKFYDGIVKATNETLDTDDVTEVTEGCYFVTDENEVIENVTYHTAYLDNKYEVTADANGGTIPATQGWTVAQGDETATKDVRYNSAYGTLPTPTRDGYTFAGWSRNLAEEINEDNYTIINGRTTTEFRNDGNFDGLTNQNYIRVNGDQGTTYVDTFWDIRNNKSIQVVAGEDYILSFYVRSENATLRQYFGIHNTSDFSIRMVWNGGASTKIQSNVNFDNDGEWHLVTIQFTVPDNVSSGKIHIAQDLPNLVGPGSYIDIANIQFTEGTSITPYYITSATTVKTPQDHTLYAKWTPNTYTVTVDANGGTIPATTGWTVAQGNATATKSVTYDAAYGTLPTPTKEGYTFVGWKEDNYFDKTDYADYSEYQNLQGSYKAKIIYLEPNTTYKVFVERHNGYDGTGDGYLLLSDQKSINGNSWTSIAHLTQPNNSYTNFEYTTDSSGELYIGALQLTQTNLDHIWANTDVYLYKIITSTKTVHKNENHTLTAIWTPSTYTVTADANGGTIPETTRWTVANGGATATKSVTYTNAYGTLPTPTRTGYTFEGWTGKNLFDMQAWLDGCNSVSWGTITKGENSITITDTTDNNKGAYTITYYVTRVNYGNKDALKIPVKPNTQYTLSWKTDSEKAGKVYIFTNYKDDVDGSYLISANSTAKKRTFTTTEDAEFIMIRFDVNNYGDSLTFSEIQLEEGSTATDYEPYYVTESTNVVQNQNHTLTAIWTPNTYTVTADANGGTIPATTGWTVAQGDATATKSVTYDDTYGTLPTPTREGYTFQGWNGKNIINIDNAVNDCLIDNGDGTYSIWYNNNGRFAKRLNVSIPSNTIVTMSYELVDYNGTYSQPLQILGYYVNGSNIYFSNEGNGKRNLANDLSGLVIYQEGSQPVGTFTRFKNLQLEVGTKATAYEPYYITSSTNVVQYKNHTLTALWTANDYALTLNNQGADTAGTQNVYYKYNTATYYSNQAKTTTISSITIPTKTGYTFGGYYTEQNGQGTQYITAAGQFTNDPYLLTADTTLYAYWKPETVANINVSNYGQYVDLGTSILSLNNVTLSDNSHPAADWRVFDKDADGVWLMLADYMPNSAFDVTDAGLEVATGDYATYGVKSTINRATLVDGLKGEIANKNWNGLLTGTSLFDGTTLASGVKVQGALDLATWVESWNSNVSYTQAIVTGDSTGYLINGENSLVVNNNDGYNDTLYFPRKVDVSNCTAYWLASASGNGQVFYVRRGGSISFSYYADSNSGVRPVVYLPNSIALDTSNSVWTIDTTSIQNVQQNNVQQNNLLNAAPRLFAPALNSMLMNIDNANIDGTENNEDIEQNEDTEENELDESTDTSNNEDTNDEITSNNEDVTSSENTQEESVESNETVPNEENSNEQVNSDESTSDDEVTEVTVKNENELVEAINQAEAGDIIKLDKDITLTHELVIPAEKEIILDLNGKTITGNVLENITENELNNNEVINLNIIKNNGNLTILGNGKITDSVVETDEETQEEVAVVKQIIINNAGTLTLENGTIEALDKNTTCLNNSGIVNLGIEDSNVSTETPEIKATILGTTAIKNNKNGKINFYDGRILTTSTITNIITNILKNYEIYEELNSNIINATLKLTEEN